MPRRSPNREDVEAGADDRDRRIKKVMKYITMFAIAITCIVILGMGIAYFVLDDKTQFRHSQPILLLAFAALIINLLLYLWLSKPQFRREIRGQYRNFRQTCSFILITAFGATHQRRIHPQPRVRVNTISVRPQPTPP